MTKLSYIRELAEIVLSGSNLNLHYGLQVPYWAKSKIAPCKSLIISNLQGENFTLYFYISKPLFYQYQSVSCCYSVTCGAPPELSHIHPSYSHDAKRLPLSS